MATPLQAADQGHTKLAPRSPGAQPGSEAELSRGKLAYERGDYGSAIAVLRPLLYPTVVLTDEGQVVLAHKLLGLSCYFEKDEACAEQEFNQLLSLRPDFALDPLVDPLKAVAFLDSMRRKNEERLEAIRKRQEEEEARKRAQEDERRRRQEAESRRSAQRIYIERVIQRRLSLLTFVPFGAPQLADGRRAVGSLLLVGEALTGGTSLAAWIAVRYRYPNNIVPASETPTATALGITHIVTGAVFWGLIITGLIDALLHSRTLISEREVKGPPAKAVPDAAERRTSAPRSLHLLLLSPAPLALPGTPPASWPSDPMMTMTTPPAFGLALGGAF